MVHHRSTDLVHGLAHSRARRPRRDLLGARRGVPDLQRGEIGGERVGAVDEHLAGELAARLDGLLGALPRGAEHDDVAACNCRVVGSGWRVEVGVLGVVGGSDAVGEMSWSARHASPRARPTLPAPMIAIFIRATLRPEAATDKYAL